MTALARRLAVGVALALLAATAAGGCATSSGDGTPSTSASGTASDPATTSRSGLPNSGTMGRPSGPLPADLRGRDWETLPTGGAKLIALTFDAGASDAGVASILATLHRTGTPGTFFLTGAFVDSYPDAARAIAARHRVGDHSATHPYLTRLDDVAVRAQITRGADRIRAVTGADPRPWFRFPYGDRDARTVADANQVGYAAIRWTVDSLGWKGSDPGGQTVASVTARVLAAARPGGIVLMHVGANPDDGTTLDADALAAIIAGLQRLGYRLVNLDALHA